MIRIPSVRWLLLGVNAFVLLVPILAILLFQIYDTHLVETTERQLIAEAVLVGEAWRSEWLEVQHLPQPDIRPPAATDERFFPETPLLGIGDPLLPALTPPPLRVVPPADTPAWQAGRAIVPLLERAQRMNLTGVRVLDHEGCVVATTGRDLGYCLSQLPEVQSALAGSYGAVKRERLSDEPAPPLTDLRRRGKIRVFVTHPIFSDGKVIGVVRVARTSIDPLEALWFHRQLLLAALLACIALTIAVSLFFAYAITRPLRAITAAALRVAHGESPNAFATGGLVPEEVASLAGSLARMAAELTNRADYIAEFAATVSHELKTPLTGIRGAAELLKESWRTMTDADRERFITNIDVDAAYLQRLSTRLLELARIQNAPETASELDLAAFVTGLTARYGKAVQLAVGEPPASITINPDHLEAAVRNLLDNAVRHGDGKPVEVRLGGTNGRAVIQVLDHGPGISAANQARIFQRFFTTERDRGGTGLGLAIVHAVAQTRGGKVTFETGANGTTFTLIL
jgi:signal transduction histidine kinase